MKVAITILALVIIAGLGWYFVGSNSDTREATTHEETQTEEMDHGTMEETAVTATESADTRAVSPDTAESEEAATTAMEQTFDIESFNYGYSMDEIRVKAGTKVTINLTSTDGFHDWVVDEFGAATEKIQTGGKTSVTFVAGEEGTYEFYCSVGQHRAHGMVGKLIVE